MAPTRSGPSKPAKRRGQPPGSLSNNKVTKGRGRPPGSRDSLPTSKPGRKPKATKDAQSDAKRKEAATAKDGGEKAGKKRGRPVQVTHEEPEEEEEADELSFTQPEVLPKPVQQKQVEQSSSSRKRGRPLRARDDQQPEDDADEISAAHDDMHLVPRTKRIAWEVIETWPHMSPQVMDQVLGVLKDAKKDIVNSQPDEQKAIAADEILGSIVRTLARQLAGSRMPPQSKDIHFNIDKLTERLAILSREMTTENHSRHLLTKQVRLAQQRLKADEKHLEQVEKDAAGWRKEWKQRERPGQLHHLLKDLKKTETKSDGPDDIGLKRSKAVDVSMLDAPDSDLAPHLEQLRRSLESLQGNHEQVAGIDVGVRNAQVALDHVLFKRASAEQYAAL